MGASAKLLCKTAGPDITSDLACVVVVENARCALLAVDGGVREAKAAVRPA